MHFMKDVIEDSIPIWDRCTETPFVQEMKSGSLPPAKFKRYIIQDSIYLRYYARVYGKAIYRSATLKEIRFFSSILWVVTNTESIARLNYLKRFGITEEEMDLMNPLPENLSYVDFMLDIVEKGDIREILMAVLPCMLSYDYVFGKVAAEPETANSKYRDIIQDYANEQYSDSCVKWCAFADEKCSSLSAEDRERFKSIFRKGSLMELDFWEMVYREE